MISNFVLILLQILLGLLALPITSTVAVVFVSIDCGSSKSFIDDKHNITWVGDDQYIKSGESRAVQAAPESSISPIYSTLRVFPTRNKNCYSINAGGKGQRVLLRAYFYYGNYDGKMSPPTFDLQFDGNDWVKGVNASGGPSYYEVIYVTKFDSLSVCLAQTEDNQYPFINGINVRSLDLGLYSDIDSGRPLFTRDRINYGGDKILRYPDDPYDRFWFPDKGGNRLSTVKRDSLNTVVEFSNKPPRSALLTAMTTDNSATLDLNLYFPKTEITIYIILYFVELLDQSNSDRTFFLYINEEASFDPITLQYGGAAYKYVVAKASSGTVFSLRSSSDSALPPLINALELFSVGPSLTNGTLNKDVRALALLQKTFTQLQEWSGDPCLPEKFTWDWVECSYQNTPRITRLKLNDLGLKGSLPDFSALDALQQIDLHNNLLTGKIPDFLGDFPNLNSLNLENNTFSGSIPASLTNNNNLKLKVSDYSSGTCASQPCKPSNNRTSNSPPSSKKSESLLILLGMIPVFVLIQYS
ncbi:PREDICTED: probable LRR receptor-like serine/threonine-protein kinase At1g05700 [Nelumbo nucifera]|uniref:Probable LRR receptor-like serine/threonine-protein kinase At1g05700 n=1 Tax=Nelumbo nucifera TaxID=4432 RepID=A0A1U7ZUF6_NELNU|nr:PREDICTED: probable LRR receptor-like serine/threonine-protein kinase At1g05700 [Nelumbo nucifera]